MTRAVQKSPNRYAILLGTRRAMFLGSFYGVQLAQEFSGQRRVIANKNFRAGRSALRAKPGRVGAVMRLSPRAPVAKADSRRGSPYNPKKGENHGKNFETYRP